MKRFGFFVTSLGLLVGCQSIPVNPAETPVVIPVVLNNSDTLAARVSNPGSTLNLELNGRVRAQAFGDDYKLVGVASAPIVNGVAVRATHVSVLGTSAFVAYAKEGDSYTGALEVVDITDPNAPKVSSSLGFSMLDVYAVYADPNANEVYFTGALDLDQLETLIPNVQIPEPSRPSFIGKVPFSNGKFGSPVTIRLTQRGYAGNSLVKTKAGLLLSSGDDQALLSSGEMAGGIGLLNADSLGTQSWGAFARAQFLAVNNDTIAALESGKNGQVRLYNTNNLVTPSSSIALGNVGPADGKNTLHLDNTFIYVAKGFGGLEMYSRSNNALAFKFANIIPNGADNAFEYTTNAVTTDGDLVYISGGAAGVYVARVPNSANNQNLNYAGRFDLLENNTVGGSANFVVADTARRLLFVASGAGGLKIIRRNVPNAKNIGTGIMARGKITINGTQNLLTGTQVSANNSSTPVPQVAALLARAVPTNCTRIITGTQNLNSQTALDALFANSNCLELRGDLNLNFNAVLNTKTLVVSSNNTLNANAGMRLTNSVLVAGRPTINSSLILNNSSLFASGNTDFNLNTATTISGASTIAAMGSVSFNGNFTTTDEYPNFLAVSQKNLTINGAANFKGILWSGEAMTLNGAITLVGSLMGGTSIRINGGITATYEARNDNPNLQ